jgi:hypothetical protein
LVQAAFDVPLDEDLLSRLTRVSRYIRNTSEGGGVYIGTQYFRKKWLPRLGATHSWLITVLRRHCFEDKRANLIRNRFDLSKQALADMLGLAVKTLTNHLKPASLKQVDPFFLEIIVSRYRVAGQIQVNDEPLMLEDEAFLQQIKQTLPPDAPISIGGVQIPAPIRAITQTSEPPSLVNGKKVTASGTEKRLQRENGPGPQEVTASADERLQSAGLNGKKVTDSAPLVATIQPMGEDHLAQDWIEDCFAQLDWQDVAPQQRKLVRNALLALPPAWQRDYLSAWVKWYQKHKSVSPDDLVAAIRCGAWPPEDADRAEKGDPTCLRQDRGLVEQQSPLISTDQQKWQQTLELLKLQLTPATFDAWLRHSALRCRVDDRLIIQVGNHYAKDWLEHRLKHVVERVASEIWSSAVQVAFFSDSEALAADKPSSE